MGSHKLDVRGPPICLVFQFKAEPGAQQASCDAHFVQSACKPHRTLDPVDEQRLNFIRMSKAVQVICEVHVARYCTCRLHPSQLFR